MTNVGVVLQGVISAHDQFTVIINDTDNSFKQQIDFLNYHKRKKNIVTVVFPIGQPLQGVITAHDMYTIILNESIIIYKNNITTINPVDDDTVLIFKNAIVAITI